MITIAKLMYEICQCNTRSPSLSGHSVKRPSSLMWPQIYATTTVNDVSSPSHQRPPLSDVAVFLGK